MELTLLSSDFRRWLQDCSPGTPVGIAANGLYCPVATWISRQFNTSRPIVDAKTILFYDRSYNFSGMMATPEWARKFILLIDGDEDEAFEEVNVFREEAIEVLNMVEGRV